MFTYHEGEGLKDPNHVHSFVRNNNKNVTNVRYLLITVSNDRLKKYFTVFLLLYSFLPHDRDFLIVNCKSFFVKKDRIYLLDEHYKLVSKPSKKLKVIKIETEDILENLKVGGHNTIDKYIFSKSRSQNTKRSKSIISNITDHSTWNLNTMQRIQELLLRSDGLIKKKLT